MATVEGLFLPSPPVRISHVSWPVESLACASLVWVAVTWTTRALIGSLCVRLCVGSAGGTLRTTRVRPELPNLTNSLKQSVRFFLCPFGHIRVSGISSALFSVTMEFTSMTSGTISCSAPLKVLSLPP